MNRPGIILTGKKAGKWYINTIDKLIETTNRQLEYRAFQINFNSINALLPHNMKAAARLLEPYFKAMDRRSQPYILANITLHEAVNFFSSAPEFFLSLDEILNKTGHRFGGKSIVLGTKFTMNHSYVKSLFPDSEFIPLSETVENQVESLRKLYIYSEDIDQAQQIFTQLDRLDADHFVIACTELSVAWNSIVKDSRWIDLPKLQCRSLILNGGAV